MTSRPISAGSAGKPPRFPKGVTTCRAAVLASLLAPGAFDTSGMFAPGAICLNVVMRALVRRYRWPIVRTDFATATGWATSWSLPRDAIDGALDARGMSWLAAVEAVRTARGVSAAATSPLETR
jgi:hypothetical protein